MKNSYLEILGLLPGATKKEIKLSYRRLSKIHHPDISNDENAKEKFIEINEAYKFLTEVGPKPHNEHITYSYDPYTHEYDQFRQRASKYARNKAREEIRLQNELIKKLLYGFQFIAAAIIAFNILMSVDYFLPKTAHDQEIIGISNIYDQFGSTLNYLYDEVYFEDFTMRFEREQIGIQDGYENAIVLATKIFSKPISAVITINGISEKYDQIDSVYAVLGYIIPLIFVVIIFYQFILRTLDHKLTLAITVIILFLIQIGTFFLF